MRTLLLSLFLLGTLAACQPPNSTTTTNTKNMNATTIDFQEGAVGTIGVHKVMFSNIMLQDYTLKDGTPKEGLAASLSLPTQKEWITAGEGYVFELEGKSYEVIAITDGEGRSSSGQVTIQAVEH